METIAILVGMRDGEDNALPAQLLAPSGLTPVDVLVALRQVEGQAIANALAAAEQRGREAATILKQENENEVDHQ